MTTWISGRISGLDFVLWVCYSSTFSWFCCLSKKQMRDYSKTCLATVLIRSICAGNLACSVNDKHVFCHNHFDYHMISKWHHMSAFLSYWLLDFFNSLLKPTTNHSIVFNSFLNVKASDKSGPLRGESTGYRWIPFTKDQWRRERSHVIRSSCVK